MSTASRSALVAVDVDEVNVALPGIELGFLRVDRGIANTHFTSWNHARVSIHHATVGFSVVGQGIIDNSTLVMVTPLRASPEATRWEGEEAREGQVSIYGPGADHFAVDAAGWELSILCADIRALEATAETLGRELGDWDGRRIRQQRPPRTMLGAGFTELDHGGDEAEVLRQVVHALSATHGYESSRGGIPSADILKRVHEYLAASGAWFPPIAALCRAAGVSERRLRSAFVDCYGLPPSRYLRARALSAVHRTLRGSLPERDSVTSIAYAHGFRHLSNFAHYYQQAYGTTPSAALRSNGH